MNRIVLLLLLSCVGLQMNAQTRKPVRKSTKSTTTVKKDTTPKVAAPSANGKFMVVGESLLNASDNKDFVVITYEGKTASELKTIVINTLSTMFNHPDKVLQSVGENVIMINSYADKCFTYCGKKGDLTHYSFNYSIKIEVRDGRLRVDAPSFSNFMGEFNYLGITKDMGPFGESFFWWAVGEAKAQTKIEDLANVYITKLVNGSSSNEEW